MATRQGKRGQPVLRVYQGERYSGDILLDSRQRVWRRADTIPPDVVLKALIAHTRTAATSGEITSRADGRVYRWHLLTQLPTQESTHTEVAELAVAC